MFKFFRNACKHAAHTGFSLDFIEVPCEDNLYDQKGNLVYSTGESLLVIDTTAILTGGRGGDGASGCGKVPGDKGGDGGRGGDASVNQKFMMKE